MGTYAELQNRIVDEIMQRTDVGAMGANLTTTRAQYAIQDAIRFWQGNRFYFNEYRTTGAFPTVIGQEFYTVADWADIPNLVSIDKMSILVSGNRYFMVARTAAYMEDISVNPSVTGAPMDYSYYNEQLRFYPIPNQIYPVNVLATKQFAVLAADGDANVWTTDAEALIRQTAKKYIWRDILLDSTEAALCDAAAMEVFKSLKAETFNRMANRRVRPSYF